MRTDKDLKNKIGETEWAHLPGNWKKRINESLHQADEVISILNADALAFIRKKYGLN